MEEKKTLHLGFIQIHEMILSVGNDGSKDGHCRYDGMLGDVFNILLDKLFASGYRCNATAFSNIGSYNGSSYTGAIGAVQSGEIDAMVMPSYYPLIDPDENFIYSPSLYEDTMHILSGYNITTDSTTGDLFTMLSQVPLGLWIGYIVSYITFILVTFLGSRLLMKKYSSLWMTTCAFLDQDNFPSNTLFVSVLSTIVMTGMFFIMTYAGNSMSTDLVTVEKPSTIDSYDHILDQNLTLLYTKVLPEFERFSSISTLISVPGRVDSKLRRFDYISKEEEMFESNSNEVILEPGITMRLLPKILGQKSVWVSRLGMIKCLANVMTGFSWFPNDGRLLIGSDSQAKKYTNVFILNSNLRGTPIECRYSQMIGRMNVHGFACYVHERMILEVSNLVHGTSNSGNPSHMKKITTKIEEKPPQLVAIGWSHVYNVLIMLGCGIFLGGMATVTEIATFSIKDWNEERKRIKLIRQRRRRRFIRTE